MPVTWVGHPSCVPMGLSTRFHREHEARQFIGDVVHSKEKGKIRSGKDEENTLWHVQFQSDERRRIPVRRQDDVYREDRELK